MSQPPWTRALVTGASSGIGRAFAQLLATDGVHLVLVARDVDRLERLATDLRSAHGVDVDVLGADLTDPAERARVEDRLVAEPAVDLLVNNAGFGTYGPFHTLDVAAEEREIELNVVTVMRLSRAVLPAMIERGAGWILNVSSMAGLQPTPLNATYGATKAFVTSFSESLFEELRGTGVKVTALLPGFTRTEFQHRAGIGEGSAALPDFVWQSAEQCAAEGLTAARAGKAVVVPGPVNKATAWSTALLPRGVKRRAVGVLSGRLKSAPAAPSNDSGGAVE